MAKHTIELEIGNQTYDELVSLAHDSGLSLDVLLLEAARRVLEDADDLAAIAAYEKQKVEGTLETIPFDEVKRRLGLEG